MFGGAVQTWMLFVLAAAYGVADGFFFPAQTAIVPQLASVDQLSGANAVIQGLDQVAQFVGPMLAGLLIAQAAAGSLGQDGIGVALAIDAATFAVSISLLALMRVDARAARRAARGSRRPEPAQAGRRGAPPREPVGLWTSIKDGLAYMWADPLLRVLLLLVLAVNFLAVGPLLVGVPALAAQRLPGGAQAYGAIMSAFGGGSLAGLAVAGAARRPPAALMGHVLLGVCAVFGAGLVVLGFAGSLVAALVPAAFMGFAAGYLAVSFFTWVQARTPQRLMGRMMSLIIFASVGLVPVSQALVGSGRVLEPDGAVRRRRRAADRRRRAGVVRPVTAVDGYGDGERPRRRRLSDARRRRARGRRTRSAVPSHCGAWNDSLKRRYAANTCAETKATPMPMTLAAVSDQKRTSPAKLSCTPRPKMPPTTCQKRKVRKRSAWAEAAKQAVAPTLTAWFTTARARTRATVAPALTATAERVPRRAVRKRCAIVLLQCRVPTGLYGRVDGGLPT